MAMVSVDSGSLYRRTHSLSRLAWSCNGWRLLGAVLHSSNEPGELSQWLCYDYSIINIVLELLLLTLLLLFSAQTTGQIKHCLDIERRQFMSSRVA